MLPSGQNLCGDAALGKDFGEKVSALAFYVSNRTGAVMGKFSHVVLHLFSTGHAAFPGGLQLCSLAPVAIQGVHSPVCQSARDQQNYPDLRHHLRHLVTLPKIWAYHTPEGTMAWNRHSRTWNTFKG